MDSLSAFENLHEEELDSQGPLLDVLQISLRLGATIEDVATLPGKEWRIALQYVLHQDGLRSAYVPPVSTEHDVWVFLIWQDAKSRSRFYGTSAGFGFMIWHAEGSPRIFFFPEVSEDILKEQSQWTIDILDSVQNSDEHKLGVQKHWEQEFLGGALVAAWQDQEANQEWYYGNDFGSMFVGIAATHLSDSERSRASSTCRNYKSKRFLITLQSFQKEQYPELQSIEAPLSIPELLGVEPYKYGLAGGDEFPHWDTAYPFDGDVPTFDMYSYRWPSSKQDEKESCISPMCETGDYSKYHMAIVRVKLCKNHPELDNAAFTSVEGVLGLQDGAYGLRKVYRLHEPQCSREIRLLAVWDDMSSCEQFQQDAVRRHFSTNATDSLILEYAVTHLWSSCNNGLYRIDDEWEPGRLVEVIEFTFRKSATPAEKQDFTNRMSAFTSLMESDIVCAWDVDGAPVKTGDDPVVVADGPFWTNTMENPGSSACCLLFLAWDGILQRDAWMKNFVAGRFDRAGHRAYALGLACAGVQSTTFKMQRIERHYIPRDYVPYEYDPETDMGF